MIHILVSAQNGDFSADMMVLWLCRQRKYVCIIFEAPETDSIVTIYDACSAAVMRGAKSHSLKDKKNVSCSFLILKSIIFLL